jgi:hypothetical protein
VALLPLVIGDASHPLTGWIKAFPLSIRIRQVPVAFGFGTLYQSGVVDYGLLGAALLAGCLLVLLVAAAEDRQLRNGGITAAIVAFVVLAPLALVALGRDYYIARNLMPAWIPLAVLIGGACAAARARAAGIVLATVLLASFIVAEARIDQHAGYQRPNWRGVASALASAPGPRAIVAYDGGLAAGPLAIYLPRVSWLDANRTPGPGERPVGVGEIDVVGSTSQTRAKALPSGFTLIGSKPVDSYLVERFALSSPLRGTRIAIAKIAESVLGPAPPGAAVVIQK